MTIPTPYDTSSHRQCGQGAAVARDPDTGRLLVVPLCCKQWHCSQCAPRLSRQWAKRAAEARPERFLTITCDPKFFQTPRDAYEAMKAAFKKFVQVWRREKIRDGKRVKRKRTFEYLAIWEIQPGTGMPHLHVLQKGHFVPHAYIRTFFENARIGTVHDIRRVYGHAGAARYVTKYTSKTSGQTKDLIGRNRLIQVSRSFFPQPTADPPPSKYQAWEWAWINADAAAIANSLVRQLGYAFDGGGFPAAVELAPGGVMLTLADLDKIFAPITGPPPPLEVSYPREAAQ